MDKTVSAPSYINSFNAIRFIAAIHIISGHVFEQPFMIHGLPDALTVLLASSASYSTSLFFVLSGFVLAYTRQRRASQNSVANEKPFHLFIQHFMKAVPYMIIGAALACAVEMKKAGFSIGLLLDFIYSISLIPPFLLRLPPLNGHSWAMSVFALGYAIDAYFGKRLSAKSAIQSVLNIFIVTCLLYFLTFIYSVLIPELPSYPPRVYGTKGLALHIFPLTRVFEIILGMLLGSFTYSQYFQIKAMLKSTFFPHWPITISIVILNLVCLSLIASMSGDSAFLATHGLLMFPMCIMLIAIATSDDWITSPSLIGVFRFMGMLSLPLYFLHIPIYRLYRFFVMYAKLSVNANSWSFMLGYLAIVLVLSMLVMSFVRATSSFRQRIKT